MSMKQVLDDAYAKKERIEAEIMRLDEQLQVAKANGDSATAGALQRSLDERIAAQQSQIREISDIREAMGMSRYDR